MANPLEFLIGTLSGIRGAFARFLRGRTAIPTVQSLAGQLRERLSGLSELDALSAARKIIDAKTAAGVLNSSEAGVSLPRSQIPNAPLYDLPGAQPGDIVSEVLVEHRTIDQSGNTIETKWTEIIIVGESPTLDQFQTHIADVIAQNEGSQSRPFGGEAMTIDVLWTFQIGD